jgi:hypothetical protein
MVLGGVALVGVGVYYFANGWRAGAFVLLFATAFGTLLFGSGMLIRSGATRARLIVATVALGLSSGRSPRCLSCSFCHAWPFRSA